MGKLDATKLAAVEAARDKKHEELTALIATPYNIKDKKQAAALKKYIDDFEFAVNRMYIYQALESTFSVGLFTTILGKYLPIPGILSDLLAYFTYVGISAYILKQSNLDAFSEQLQVMKALYNWCLKGGEVQYNPEIDNTEKLANAGIQRMIKLMAPLCTTDYLIAWPKETEARATEGGASVASKVANAASGVYGYFFSTPTVQPNVNTDRVRDLKVGVETRAFDLSTIDAAKQGATYFANHTEMKDVIACGWKATKDMLTLPADMFSTAPRITVGP